MRRPRSIHRPGLTLLALGALVMLAGCGGDDSATGGDAAQVDTTGVTETVLEEETAPPPDCPATEVTWSNTASGTSGTLTSGAAVSLGNRAAYTAYVTDFPITADDLGFTNPTVPEGDNMFMIAVTIFNAEGTPGPLEAETLIATGGEYGSYTFVVVHQQGEESFGNSTNSEGTMTVTAVGDTFCAQFDYRDGEKQLSGTILAPVRDL